MGTRFRHVAVTLLLLSFSASIVEAARMPTRILSVAGLALAIAVAGCDGAPTASRIPTTLLSLNPAGGAVQVVPGREIVVAFSGSMMAGMEQYVELHEGAYTGPVVTGTWRWGPPSAASLASRFGGVRATERTTLIFTPDQPLRRGAEYTIHLGGRLRDAGGRPIDYVSHGKQHMGGDWVGPATMMGGGMTVGQGHMVPGWQHANGSYGMGFTFTTAA